MGLAASATDVLTVENETLVGVEIGGRHEEPLALASEGGIVAAVTFPCPDTRPGLLFEYSLGFQGLLGLTNRAGGVGDARHEPVALIVAAKELPAGWSRAAIHHEKQMSIRRIGIQNPDIEALLSHNQIEGFPLAGCDYVNRVVTGATANKADLVGRADSQVRPDLPKLGCQK
jgi:hypothetical protein